MPAYPGYMGQSSLVNTPPHRAFPRFRISGSVVFAHAATLMEEVESITRVHGHGHSCKHVAEDFQLGECAHIKLCHPMIKSTGACFST